MLKERKDTKTISPFSLPLFHQIFHCLHRAGRWQPSVHPSTEARLAGRQADKQQVFTPAKPTQAELFSFPAFPSSPSPSPHPTFPR